MFIIEKTIAVKKGLKLEALSRLQMTHSINIVYLGALDETINEPEGNEPEGNEPEGC